MKQLPEMPILFDDIIRKISQLDESNEQEISFKLGYKFVIKDRIVNVFYKQDKIATIEIDTNDDDYWAEKKFLYVNPNYVCHLDCFHKKLNSDYTCVNPFEQLIHIRDGDLLGLLTILNS